MNLYKRISMAVFDIVLDELGVLQERLADKGFLDEGNWTTRAAATQAQRLASGLASVPVSDGMQWYGNVLLCGGDTFQVTSSASQNMKTVTSIASGQNEFERIQRLNEANRHRSDALLAATPSTSCWVEQAVKKHNKLVDSQHVYAKDDDGHPGDHGFGFRVKDAIHATGEVETADNSTQKNQQPPQDGLTRETQRIALGGGRGAGMDGRSARMGLERKFGAGGGPQVAGPRSHFGRT